VHEHRRQEHHRGVQVEHCRHDGNEAEQRDQERLWSQRRPREARTDGLEQPVVRGDGADQQQAGDEHEGWPGLRCRG